MNGKKLGTLLGLLIGLIVIIPLIIGFLSWNAKNSNDPGNPENLEEGIGIMSDSIIPWWLGILEKLANIGGIVGAILVVGFVLFLKWINQVK